MFWSVIIHRSACCPGWGAGATTLRTVTLALVHSTTEHCAPVWCRSAHTRLIDRRCANGGWLLACYISGKPSYPRRHPTCWASSHTSHTVSSMPCHGTWTSARGWRNVFQSGGHKGKWKIIEKFWGLNWQLWCHKHWKMTSLTFVSMFKQFYATFYKPSTTPTYTTPYLSTLHWLEHINVTSCSY